AQIVYTLTELEGVDRVTFSIDGVFIPVPTDRGLRLPFDPNVAQGVSRADYASALPQVPVVEPGTLGPAPATTPTPTPTPGG
ncbi:MAG: GerMN domain-containing protein, partial [Acidimicrobiaceae bacterium]|nr:GerMN domain-containing protein [Acidimicrobiaceae bacterium]